MCGTAHLHGEEQLECETESVGSLKKLERSDGSLVVHPQAI